jgi:large subunit ribosomal protein L25
MPIVIEAQTRSASGKNANRRLRKSGRIPAVVYGPGKQPVVVSVNPADVEEVLYSGAGRNTIVGLSVDGSGQNNAMVKDYQLDPVQGNLIHADFLEIAMNRLLELTVNIELIGEAEGVKIGGGIMDFVTRSIEVECLPSDIPDSIKVDVSALEINDYVRVKNLEVDSKVKVLSDPEIVIVTIVPPTKEEVPVEAAPEAVEPEVVKKGKGEEGEEEEQKAKTPKPEAKQ